MKNKETSNQNFYSNLFSTNQYNIYLQESNLKFHGNQYLIDNLDSLLKKIKSITFEQMFESEFNEMWRILYSVKLEIAKLIDILLHEEYNEIFQLEEINKITFALTKHTSIEEKISFLKNEKLSLLELFEKEDNEFTLLFIGIPCNSQCRDWIELLAAHIDFDDDLFRSYIKGVKIKDLPISELDEFIDFYRSYYITKMQIEFINKILENPEVLGSTNSTSIVDLYFVGIKESINQEVAIFKNKGELFFKYLSKVYPDKKNTAFYSYLYFFLKEKNLLEVNGNDNISFRRYVIKNTDLKEFKRIQTTNSKNQFKKDSVFSIFEKIYSDEIEDILSNNE